LQLFVLIVMGFVRSADFVHKSAWAQASRYAIYFSARGDGALDLAG